MRLINSIILACTIFACAVQTAEAQGAKGAKGAIAFEDCIGFESNLSGNAPSKTQVRIRAGEIFSFGERMVTSAAGGQGTAKPSVQRPQRDARQSNTWEDLKGGPGVYLLGNADFGRTIWKDSKPYVLPDSRYSVMPNFLYVSGNDVYVAGSAEIDGYHRAMLWKNGVAQQLDNVASRAIAVVVSGTDVYVVGVRGQEAAQRPVLWKNGVMQELSEKRGSEAWVPIQVSVSGSDVIVAGYRTVYISDSSDFIPVLWKSGSYMEMAVDGAFRRSGTEILTPTWGYSVFLSGGDLYSSGAPDYRVLKVWRNGKPHTEFRTVKSDFDVPQGSYFHSPGGQMFVSGGDVYVTGTAKGRARLFKNGIEQKMAVFENPDSLQEISAVAKAVFASGSDVYVVGERGGYSAGGKYHGSALVIWKNGVIQQIFEGGFDDNISSFGNISLFVAR